MVTVAIMAVLAALAAPSFTPLIERWRVRQVTEDLQSTLYFARSEAMKRGGNIVLQKLPNNTGKCTTASGNSDWDCGWFVCLDANANGSCAASETVLQRYDAPANVQISRPGSGTGASIQFNRWGLPSGALGLSFNVVPMNASTANPAARGVCMSSGGRVRVIPSEEIPCNG